MSSELKKASSGIKFIGSIVALLIFGAIVLLWPRGKQEGLDEKRAKAREEKLAALQKENHEKLFTYAWVSKDKQIVQIPIDQAMKVVAVELAAKPIISSTVKVEVPYPYGLQQTPTPAPAASGTGATAPAASGSAAPAPAVSGTAAPTPAASGSAAPPPAQSGTAPPPTTTPGPAK